MTYEASARTVDEAIKQGLEALGVTIDKVEYQVIEEGSKGLFGLFGSRNAKVRLTVKEDEEDLLAILKPAVKEAPKPAPKAEKMPEVRPAKKAEPKPEVKAEVKPEVKTEAKPEVKAEKKPEVRPEPVRRVKPAEKKPEPKPEEPVAVEVAAETVQPAAENDAPAAEEAPARSHSRHSHNRKPRAEKTENRDEQQPQEKKPLPPKAPARPLERPVVTMIPDDQVDAESAAGKAQAFLKELTGLMGVEVQVTVGNDEEGNVFANITGDTLGILIGRRGETLDALQYLTSLKVNRGQEGYTRVTIDTEGYRAKREDTLTRLANRMANRAVKTGRKVSLEPMNPYERRIIHSALQANEAVDTHSEGEEPNRHVVITLRK